jgi:hypothetical protein
MKIHWVDRLGYPGLRDLIVSGGLVGKEGNIDIGVGGVGDEGTQ